MTRQVSEKKIKDVCLGKLLETAKVNLLSKKYQISDS